MQAEAGRGWGLLGAVVAILLAAGDASALATYAYVGNPFDDINIYASEGVELYTTQMRVTGSITLDAPLAADLPLASIADRVVAARLDDGVQTLSLDSPDFLDLYLRVATDAAGNISSWDFVIAHSDGEHLVHISTYTEPSVPTDFGYFFSPAGDSATALVSGNPGSWTRVPEPSTAVLAGLGLGLAGVSGRRRRSGR